MAKRYKSEYLDIFHVNFRHLPKGYLFGKFSLPSWLDCCGPGFWDRLVARPQSTLFRSSFSLCVCSVYLWSHWSEVLQKGRNMKRHIMPRSNSIIIVSTCRFCKWLLYQHYNGGSRCLKFEERIFPWNVSVFDMSVRNHIRIINVYQRIWKLWSVQGSTRCCRTRCHAISCPRSISLVSRLKVQLTRKYHRGRQFPTKLQEMSRTRFVRFLGKGREGWAHNSDVQSVDH